MRMSRGEFLAWEHKAVTLLGMSGVGKTTLSGYLPKSRWFHFSGDYRIATKYLYEPILDNIKREAMQVPFLRDLLRSDSVYIRPNITVDNLAPISTFLGKLGDPAHGGLPVEEFKRRQRLHHDAEIAAMGDVAEFITKGQELYGYAHFVNDAGGSLCELDSPEVLAHLAEHTVIVYLRADAAMEREMVRRAEGDPKPLYYSESFLDENLADYLAETGRPSAGQIEPDAFVQWVFPRLLEHRRPLYEDIAARYGYALDAGRAASARGEDELVSMIADALGNDAGQAASAPSR